MFSFKMWFALGVASVPLGLAGCAVGGKPLALPVSSMAAATAFRAGVAAGSATQRWAVRSFSTGSGAKSSKITIFAGPSSSGGGVQLASGLKKSLWFGLVDSGEMVSMTTKGVATTYPIPTPNSDPEGVTQANGKMWFTEWNAGNVGAVSSSGKVLEYPLSVNPSEAVSMATGSDGNAWFTTDGAGIGRVTKSGHVTIFPLPDNSNQPWDMTLGPDGNIWFIEFAGPNVGKITTAGVVTEYATGAEGGYGIAAGSDGNIWFTDATNKRVGKIAINGTGLTYYSQGFSGTPQGLAAGPDGNLYFTEPDISAVARITTAGTVEQYTIPVAFAALGITAGPDGNIWFLDNQHSQIGRLKI